ncbi:MAG TPA: adenylate kinase [Vicinamibacterales bacterium]|jgi:adenylate kinase|nr:adenylate kinase [Vicinamibacterales bacterium]
MDLVLLGAPGSGKGTQADHLRRELGLTHVASGDLFRDHLQRKTDLGLRASDYMTRGALVPDEITIAMLRERVIQPDTANGVLLDGFPRTMEQTIALNEMLAGLGREIDAVLYVEVPDEVLVERLSGRLICRECQAPFHKTANPFRVCPHGKCEGQHLYQRADDAPETVKARLATYHRQTAPVIDYYRLISLLVTVPADGPVDEVKRATLEAVRQLARKK